MAHPPVTPPRQARRLAWWHRVWHALVLTGPLIPATPRDRAWVTTQTLVLHARPVRVPVAALGITRTFGLGGAAIWLLFLLAGTGLLLMLAYHPSPTTAYASVVAIERELRFGTLIRGMHYWSAGLLVVVTVLHMLRVLFTGGYHGPRQFNWVVGVCLLGLVLSNAFTGYLLPWDQLAYWAVTISTGALAYIPGVGVHLQQIARGGHEIGPHTLILFHTLHTTLVPALLAATVAFHAWRVRKARGIILPAAIDGVDPRSTTVHVLPYLLVREASFALVLLAAVTVLGAVVGAPLGDAANPGMSPNPAKAPWYFMGIQELLIHVHPVVAVGVVPAVFALALVALPYLAADDEPQGDWWRSDRGKAAAGLAAVAAAVATPALVVAHHLIPIAGTVTHLTWPGRLATVTACAATAAGSLWLIRARLRLTRNESLQTAAVAGVVAYISLTLIGVWCRGPGMVLVWPWTR